MVRSEHYIRHSIVVQAQSFSREGFYNPVSDSIAGRYKKKSSEAITIWNENKLERNAIVAVLVDRVVDRAIDLRSSFPPLGLSKIARFRTYIAPVEIPTRKENAYPYIKIHDGMRHTLGAALVKEISELENMLVDKENTDPIKSVYARYKQIVKFGNRHSRRMQTIGIIGAGIGTAVGMSVGILELVPKVYEQQFPDQKMEPAKLTAIVRGSYPLVTDLAAQHLDEFLKRMKFLVNKRPRGAIPFAFKPEYFKIDAGDNPRLLLKEEIKQKMEDLGKASTDFGGSIATGCPALGRFGGVSAVRKLWDWNAEIADALYNKLYGNLALAA